MRFDGQAPPGIPPAGNGAGVSASKLVPKDEVDRAIVAEFNGERVAGRTWSAQKGHLVYLEITK